MSEIVFTFVLMPMIPTGACMGPAPQCGTVCRVWSSLGVTTVYVFPGMETVLNTIGHQQKLNRLGAIMEL